MLISQIEQEKISVLETANLLGLSQRQIYRILKRVKSVGSKGIIHKLRGRKSNRGYPEELKEKISLQDEDFKTLRNEFETLGKNVDGLKITGQPTFQSEKIMNMLYNLVNQQQEMSKVLEKVTGEQFDIIIPKFGPDSWSKYVK